MTTPQQRKTATRSALVQGTALAAMGALHFVRPEHFDALIPASLPGSARAWTLGSGVAELGVAALLLNRRTRRTGGRAAVALYLGVWPGNFQMAWDYRNKAPLPKLIAWTVALAVADDFLGIARGPTRGLSRMYRLTSRVIRCQANDVADHDDRGRGH